MSRLTILSISSRGSTSELSDGSERGEEDWLELAPALFKLSVGEWLSVGASPLLLLPSAESSGHGDVM